jgi:hypothetical protein
MNSFPIETQTANSKTSGTAPACPGSASAGLDCVSTLRPLTHPSDVAEAGFLCHGPAPVGLPTLAAREGQPVGHHRIIGYHPTDQEVHRSLDNAIRRQTVNVKAGAWKSVPAASRR